MRTETTRFRVSASAASLRAGSLPPLKELARCYPQTHDVIFIPSVVAMAGCRWRLSPEGREAASLCAASEICSVKSPPRRQKDGGVPVSRFTPGKVRRVRQPVRARRAPLAAFLRLKAFPAGRKMISCFPGRKRGVSRSHGRFDSSSRSGPVSSVRRRRRLRWL